MIVPSALPRAAGVLASRGCVLGRVFWASQEDSVQSCEALKKEFAIIAGDQGVVLKLAQVPLTLEATRNVTSGSWRSFAPCNGKAWCPRIAPHSALSSACAKGKQPEGASFHAMQRRSRTAPKIQRPDQRLRKGPTAATGATDFAGDVAPRPRA